MGQAHRGERTHACPLVQVTEGSGKILVLAVGEDSEWGRTMAMVVGESPDTPLQEHLAQLASSIGKLGLFVGVVCFLVLLVRCGPERQSPRHAFQVTLLGGRPHWWSYRARQAACRKSALQHTCITTALDSKALRYWRRGPACWPN